MNENLQKLTKNILINKNKTTPYLIKRIIFTNLLSLIIIVITYIWIVYFLSNLSSFWDIFRGKDVYIEKDIVAPLKPYLNPITEATKEDKIDVTGQSESGVKIILKVDGKKYQETVADSEGKFSFASIPVGFLSQVLLVEATDEAGNVSSPSQSYTIVKDIEAPEFEIISPAKDGETLKSTGRTYKVIGKTEPGINVHVNEQIAVMNTIGEFSASIRLEEGSNEIKIKAVDKAGNEKEETRKIYYEKID